MNRRRGRIEAARQLEEKRRKEEKKKKEEKERREEETRKNEEEAQRKRAREVDQAIARIRSGEKSEKRERS